jgi:hypothetical protein
VQVLPHRRLHQAEGPAAWRVPLSGCAAHARRPGRRAR